METSVFLSELLTGHESTGVGRARLSQRAAATILPDGALEFQTAPGEDIRPRVARAVIESGYDLVELRPVGMSLEEIFLQLTQNNSIS